MSSVTLTLPDDLAERMRDLADRIPRTFEVALRSVLRADAPTVDAVDEVTQFLTTLPTPEQILAFRASPAVEERISALMEKNRTAGLSEDEEREWQTYEYAGHLVRMAKANAALKLKDPGGQ